MTTAAESHDAQLAVIKAKHEAIRERISAPEREVGDVVNLAPAMSTSQAGLREVRVDNRFRLWLCASDKLVMIFDPKARDDTAQALADVIGHDPDDTQAAQGFRAHED